MDGHDKEWAVAFHGFRTNMLNVIPIIIKLGLKKGEGQASDKNSCKVFKNNVVKQQCGNSIYCAPKIGTALQYANHYFLPFFASHYNNL